RRHARPGRAPALRRMGLQLAPRPARLAALPWDYTASVVEHARSSPDLLDLGTGGGEWLAELSYRPPRTVATESWGPNVAIASARLRPLGVDVVQVAPARDNTGKPVEGAASPLPFPDEAFHLVVDRHER